MSLVLQVSFFRVNFKRQHGEKKICRLSDVCGNSKPMTNYECEQHMRDVHHKDYFYCLACNEYVKLELKVEHKETHRRVPSGETFVEQSQCLRTLFGTEYAKSLLLEMENDVRWIEKHQKAKIYKTYILFYNLNVRRFGARELPQLKLKVVMWKLPNSEKYAAI
jgi:hypothetical protein